MTLAAYCCWVISPRYFYHIYNRWGSQTTERGKQSLPLCEDSHFLPCKDNSTKRRSCAPISRGGARGAASLFYPGADGVEGQRAEGRRTEGKARGKPRANVQPAQERITKLKHRNRNQKSFLTGLGMRRGSGGNAFYYE